MNDDERNVDERPILENHRNNTRTAAEESSAIAGAFGATAGTTVTNPSSATSGQTVTNNDDEGELSP